MSLKLAMSANLRTDDRSARRRRGLYQKIAGG
jgi:hypothetical protein